MMLRPSFCLASVLVLLVVAAPSTAQDPPAAAQPDALPEHALVRLGSWTQRQRRPVTCVTFVEGSKSLLAANDDGTVALWDLTTGLKVRQFTGHEEGVKCVAVAPDKKTIATAGWEGSVRLWDLATAKPLHIVRTHEQGVSTVAYSPDGKWLASGGSDATVRLWNLQGGAVKEERCYQTPGGRPVSVAFSPDSKLLVAGGTDSSLHFWNVATGSKLRTINEQRGWILHVAFSPDGRLLATGGNDACITLWDVASGVEMKRFQERAEILSVAFAPDGRTLVSGSYDNTVHLWEVATGQPVWSRAGHANGVLSVAFAGDGRTLASGSSDTTVLVWDVTGLRKDGKFAVQPLTVAELDSSWRELGDSPAAEGQAAVWRLVADAKQSVPLLKTRLRPITAIEPAKLRQLIQSLDSDRFAVREQATLAIERLDELAVPPLQQALNARPSAEAQRRLTALITKLSGSVMPPERLRGIRAIQVLEQIGNDEAMELLKAVSEGPAEATLTAEARGSLTRLQQGGTR